MIQFKPLFRCRLQLAKLQVAHNVALSRVLTAFATRVIHATYRTNSSPGRGRRRRWGDNADHGVVEDGAAGSARGPVAAAAGERDGEKALRNARAVGRHVLQKSNPNS